MIRIVFIFVAFFSLLFANEITLTKAQEEYIAQKVWQNEGAGLDKYLIHWNDGEDFISLGIGHFIWFSKDHTERFREVFPLVLEYMQKRGVVLPDWLDVQSDCPWSDKVSFMRSKTTKDATYTRLFDFIDSTRAYQAGYMADRLQRALPAMLETIDDGDKRALIEDRFNAILLNADGSINEHGLYVLLDYVNFKGEGTLKSERYNGEGWGLLQVLEHMDANSSDRFKAFSDSAKAMLDRRIKNSPKERGESRWRAGWFKRLDTYILDKQ
ncbi:MAG: hypothetical protein P8Y49_07550 [Sulfurovaceae bacterium]